MIALYLSGLLVAGAAIALAMRAAWRRRPRPFGLVSRCEICERIAEIKLAPYRDSCRWACEGCRLSLNDNGSGP